MSVNNKNNKTKKRFTNGKKPFKPYGTNQNMKKKKSKTLFIGKIYNEDIGDSQVSNQLASHRINYLKSVLESYGEVEHFSNNIENNNFVLVTYKTREMAESALKKLKSKNENEHIMNQIKEQLRKSKLPDTVCPLLFRYKYDWSDKPSRTPKNAYSMKKVAYQKNEKTPSTTATTTKSSTTPKEGGKKKKNELKENGKASLKNINDDEAGNNNKKKKKKKKKAKKKYQKKTGEEEGEEQGEENSKVSDLSKKSEQKKEKVSAESIVKKEEKRIVDADGLRREADKAKLQDELEYLAAQLENVQSEINAENKRCKDRDIRINKLSEELRRVDLTKERLERQLANERRWKKLNQETVNQLNQELEHIREEQQSATLRLNSNEANPFSFTS